MKKQNCVVIIGCSISSMYAAIKLLDKGYKVTIIDKKISILPIEEKYFNNFNIYNENHKTYINLLNKFNISSEEINIFNDAQFSLLINKIQTR